VSRNEDDRLATKDGSDSENPDRSKGTHACEATVAHWHGSSKEKLAACHIAAAKENSMHRRENYSFRDDDAQHPLAPPSPRPTTPHSEAGAHGFRRGIRHLVLVEEPPTVTEIMSPNPYCALLDTKLEELAHLLIDRCISGVPVVDADNRPLGIVTKADLLREMRSATDQSVDRSCDTRQNAACDRSREADFHACEFSSRTARDVMLPIVFCLPENATISQAAALMAFESVQRIPIVDKRGRITGVISTLDILRWMARREGYLIP
jgi:CBS domain-containing protein